MPFNIPAAVAARMTATAPSDSNGEPQVPFTTGLVQDALTRFHRCMATSAQRCGAPGSFDRWLRRRVPRSQARTRRMHWARRRVARRHPAVPSQSAWTAGGYCTPAFTPFARLQEAPPEASDCARRRDILSGRRDLNPRRPPWQGGTLPLSYSRNASNRDPCHVARAIGACQRAGPVLASWSVRTGSLAPLGRRDGRATRRRP